MTVWLIGAAGFLYIPETLWETLMTVSLIVPRGLGIFISSWNPVRNPNDSMVNYSMGLVDFDIYLKPFKKP